MSDYVEKPGSGTLFKNNDKKSSKHPDYSGSYTNEKGEKCNIAAWEKIIKDGKEILSLSVDFVPWEARNSQPPQPEAPSTDAFPAPNGGDVPF